MIDDINYVWVEIKFDRSCFNKDYQITDSKSHEVEMHFFAAVQVWFQIPVMLRINWLDFSFLQSYKSQVL